MSYNMPTKWEIFKSQFKKKLVTTAKVIGLSAIIIAPFAYYFIFQMKP